MKKIIIVLFLFVFLSLINQKKEEYIIPDSAIRLRVIANSNTFEDQAKKMEIKKNVENIVKEDLLQATNKQEAKQKIEERIPDIKTMINNYNTSYRIQYGQNYFPEKSYKGIKYKEGQYESLVITLGEGAGENWWCVLFPPLCLMEATNENTSDVDYELFIKEVFKKYM